MRTHKCKKIEIPIHIAFVETWWSIVRLINLTNVRNIGSTITIALIAVIIRAGFLTKENKRKQLPNVKLKVIGKGINLCSIFMRPYGQW